MNKIGFLALELYRSLEAHAMRTANTHHILKGESVAPGPLTKGLWVAGVVVFWTLCPDAWNWGGELCLNLLRFDFGGG